MLSADLAAYKRLTADGLEPAGVDGCATLEASGASAARIEERPEIPEGMF